MFNKSIASLLKKKGILLVLSLPLISSCVFNQSNSNGSSLSPESSDNSSTSSSTNSESSTDSGTSSSSFSSASTFSSSSSSSSYSSNEAGTVSKRKVKYTAKDIDPTYSPSTGNVRLLVVPISLKTKHTYSFTSSVFESLKETVFTDTDLSLSAYYKRASYGKLNITGEVVGKLGQVYEANYSEDYFAYTESTEKTKFNTLYSIMNSALNWAKNTYKINLSDYDLDGDGYIDSVHFLFDGSDQDGWNNNALWPHMSFTGGKAGTKDSPKVNVYSASNLGHFENGDSITMIHEQGHIFGLEDYYNYEYSDTGNKTLPDYIGQIDMQNNNSMDWNSFSKLSMGWIEPYVIDESFKGKKTVTLKSSALNNDALVLSTNWNGTAFDEYFLFELYTNDGNNSYFWNTNGYSLGNGGVKVYHVDARFWGFNESDYDNTTGLINGGDFISPEDVVLGQGSYKYYNPATSNSTGDYATPVVACKNFQLLHLLQRGGSNTFASSSAKARRLLNSSDLFVTGDTFTIGNHTGYKNYGSFMPTLNKLNSNEAFPYGVKFDKVTKTEAVITIEYLGNN